MEQFCGDLMNMWWGTKQHEEDICTKLLIFQPDSANRSHQNQHRLQGIIRLCWKKAFAAGFPSFWTSLVDLLMVYVMMMHVCHSHPSHVLHFPCRYDQQAVQYTIRFTDPIAELVWKQDQFGFVFPVGHNVISWWTVLLHATCTSHSFLVSFCRWGVGFWYVECSVWLNQSLEKFRCWFELVTGKCKYHPLFVDVLGTTPHFLNYDSNFCTVSL